MPASIQTLISRSAFLESLRKATTTDGEMCAICQEPFADDDSGEMPVSAHNGHIFGEACLRHWLEDNNTCPLCRCVLFAPDVIRAEPVPQRPTTSDGRLLERLFEGDSVEYEAARHFGDHEGTTSSLLMILYCLQRRVRRYQDGSYDGEVAYPPLGSHGQAPRHVPGEAARPVSAAAACLVLWARWWRSFDATNIMGRRLDLHHPIASAILFATMEALREWDGWEMTAHSLFHCLRPKIHNFCTRHLRLEQIPENWAGYINDMLFSASIVATSEENFIELAASRGFDLQDHAYLMLV